MGIIGDIWQIVKDIKTLKVEYEKAEQARRENIADYFERISMCLSDVHTKLSRNETPHGGCAELRRYAEMLPSTIGKEIGDKKAEEFKKRLEAAHEVERLIIDLSESPNREEELKKLDEASGELKALSVSIRHGYKMNKQ
jgi:hypothetical protein